MHFAVIARIIGMLLMVFSLTMLAPALVSIWYADGNLKVFLASFAITFITGGALWLSVRRRRGDLTIRDGFLVVALFWLVLGVFGATPLWLSVTPSISIVDAVFESISGLTTTGATVLTGLDDLPKSLLFYRQLLQWLGGIGIIVIAVAILPLLGIGGMQLYRAETPGPVKDSKLTPRITGTAKALFNIYFVLTVSCAVCYWLAGMEVFEAVCHAFSTVAIGGFSTHDASIGYFNNDAVTMVACVFMVLAGINFAIHFAVWRGKQIGYYFDDAEVKFYFFLLLFSSLFVAMNLKLDGVYDMDGALLNGIFHTLSMATTTGFATENFALWPGLTPFFLILLSCIGGCAGSTGGGVKVVRVMLMAKQGLRELAQLVHPNAVIPLKVGSKRVEAKVVSAVWSFFAVYLFSYFIIMGGCMFTGLDFETAFSATAGMLNNLGPGLGAVAENYGGLPDTTKWLLSFGMLLGRLEIFTLLVLFTPAFWRH